MKYLHKFVSVIFILSLIIIPFSAVAHHVARAEVENNIIEKKTELTIFWREECSYCYEAMEFIDTIQPDYPELVINKIDLNTPDGEAQYEEFTNLLKLPKVTPIIQLNTEVITGFSPAYGEKIKETLDSCKGNTCLDLDSFLEVKQSANITEYDENIVCDEEDFQCRIVESENNENISVPWFGEINAKKFSLPLIASVLGLIDGFNPCAMWVLIMFLTILMQTGSRKLMFQIAGLFVFAETVMYYLILNVWFTTWNFIGLDKIVTPIVAVIAIGAGVYFIYEYIKLPPGVCIISSPKQQKRTRDKITDMVKRPLTFISALGIIGIAFSVNIIEFACSIGIPQTFTKILDLNNLSILSQQTMMFIYIFFYMIDDFIVFGLALYSFDKIGIAEKYSKQCQLLGGVLMIVLGLILLFKREWLVF